MANYVSTTVTLHNWNITLMVNKDTQKLLIQAEHGDHEMPFFKIFRHKKETNNWQLKNGKIINPLFGNPKLKKFMEKKDEPRNKRKRTAKRQGDKDSASEGPLSPRSERESEKDTDEFL